MENRLSRRSWIRSATMTSIGLPLARLNLTTVLDHVYQDHEFDIKISSNENPYGPSDSAKKAIIKNLPNGNRYAGDLLTKLRGQLAARENLNQNQILFGAGSTQILILLAHLLGRSTKTCMTSEKCFPVLKMNTAPYGTKWINIPLDKSFRIDIKTMLRTMHTQAVDAIYICNPNNPTATFINIEELSYFCKRVPKSTLLIVDEAYIEYIAPGYDQSVAHLIRAHENLIVVRTFSKLYGLAGLRMGYAIAQPQLIQAIKQVNIHTEAATSVSGISAAMASMEDKKFAHVSRSYNDSTRAYLKNQFDQWNIPVTDSFTNFMYFPIDKFELRGKSFRQEMIKNKIKCPPFDNDKSNYSRMTIGTQKEMEFVVSVLSQLI